jgi:hypothetical protein
MDKSMRKNPRRLDYAHEGEGSEAQKETATCAQAASPEGHAGGCQGSQDQAESDPEDPQNRSLA